MTPTLLIAIALGGACGAAARVTLSSLVQRRAGRRFPWGTLSVNVAGSILLGFVLPLLQRFAPVPPGTEPLAAMDLLGPASPIRAFITVGCIGAFTTFSTFAVEAVGLLREQGRFRAAAYIAASVLLGLAGIATGLGLAGLLTG